MAELTGSVVDICDFLMDLITSHMGELGIAALFYGDQERLPVTPTVCIEPDDTTSTLSQARRMVAKEFKVYILIYHSKVIESSTNRRDSDFLAREIENLIHTEPRLGGLVIHGFVTNISSGYANRERTTVRASRMTFEARSQELLPS